MAKQDVVMPQMGESVMEGTVLEWHKQVGDPVEADEALLEVETDKVDSEVPAPVSGILVEILVPEGETVEAGAVLARIETDVDAAGTSAPADAPTDAEPRAPEPEPPSRAEPEPQAAAASPGAGPLAPAAGAEVTDVVMPKMGESVMEGTVLEWRKQPGDPIGLDEPLLDIGTDKVDSEIPAPAAGVLLEILVPAGETVDVGTVLARIASEATASAAAPPAAPTASAAPAATPEAKPSSGPAAPAAQAVPAEAGPIPRRGPDGRFYSPLVRSIAEQERVSMQELESVAGSGKDGRVTKKDLLAYIEQRKTAPRPTPAPTPARSPAPTPMPAPAWTPAGDRVEVVEMDRMRQLIADHMIRSISTAAHVTSFAEVDVTNLVRLREARKEVFFQREGVKLTYTPFFVRAAVESLRSHPYLNASIEGTKILLRKDFHVGIAVAVGQKGLVVPVIRNAGGMNLLGLAHTASGLAERARSKQLQPDELQGGTFTVTNIGSLGSLIGTPIINQPQVAILAAGAIKKRPVVVEDPELGDVIAIRHMMFLSLTYDHRLIDGAMAASFLQTVIRNLESIDPNTDL